MTPTRIMVAGMGLLAVLGAPWPVAGQVSPGQPLLQKLQEMDANKDGQLSYEEIVNGYNINTPNMLEFFKRRDANGNGVIDKDEIPARRFSKLDLNGNGSITSEEFLVANSKKASDFVVRADSNRDGMITSDELGQGLRQAAADASVTYDEIAAAYYKNPAKRKRLFTLLDVDSGGSIEPAEWPDAKTFPAADANADGRISEQEFMEAHAEVTKALVMATDLNKDGRISVAEVRRSLK